uniref:Conserved hypothetical protein CHP02391 domain-containing protein n=1 Tax=uncultured Candidatus Melainabacteria bacterium TaxID=2682970 RepID=A0A650ELC7_9BACT|nr:hypothetical protein Melaina855_1410 [uncultured Candidatus Melainabacteria bacterium]
MNKKEYLKSIIDEARDILSTAERNGQFIINTYSGQRSLLISKYSFEKWMSKTNSFLEKYNYKNYQIKTNGQTPYSEIMLSKLAAITALYESFELDEDCIGNLSLIPLKSVELFRDKHYESAVFIAFKQIEIIIKEKTGLTELYGANLVKNAFGPSNGPLRDSKLLSNEQTAQMELFSGALCSIKNPESHKNITYSEQEAIELLSLANFLLRILQNK